MAKLKNDPNLCELSQQALAGYLAEKCLTETNIKNTLSEQDLMKKQQLICNGKEAENIICNYVDFLMSTENPCNPDDGNWVKPDIHPCKKHFENIPKQDWDKDYDNLVNLVQRHTQCSTAYCLRKKMKMTITPVDLTILKTAVIKLTWSMRKSIQKIANFITRLK